MLSSLPLSDSSSMFCKITSFLTFIALYWLFWLLFSLNYRPSESSPMVFCLINWLPSSSIMSNLSSSNSSLCSLSPSPQVRNESPWRDMETFEYMLRVFCVKCAELPFMLFCAVFFLEILLSPPLRNYFCVEVREKASSFASSNSSPSSFTDNGTIDLLE